MFVDFHWDFEKLSRSGNKMIEENKKKKKFVFRREVTKRHYGEEKCC
tara:strand:- start:154 stop:294 length:141 start_codon:yes stop_codon:yes gene_type:complete